MITTVIIVIDWRNSLIWLNLIRNRKILFVNLSTITDVVFLTCHRRWQHTTSCVNTYQYAKTHSAVPHITPQAHSSFQHRYRSTLFQVTRDLYRNTWTFFCYMIRTWQTSKEWNMIHVLRPSDKIGPSVQRESTGRVIIIIVVRRVIERKEKEWEMSSFRSTERDATRDLQNTPVCTFKSSVSYMTLLTGAFRTHTRERFSVQDKKKHTTHNTQHTIHTTHNTRNRQHTHTRTTQRHVKRESDENERGTWKIERDRHVKRERSTCREKEGDGRLNFSVQMIVISDL